MKNIDLSIENHSFTFLVPKEAEQDVEEFIAMANSIPVSLTINNKNFILVCEEDFDELMATEEDFDELMATEEDYFHCDTEECDIDFTQEDLDNSMVSLILGLLENNKFNSTQLFHMEEVVSALGIVAVAREVYREGK